MCQGQMKYAGHICKHVLFCPGFNRLENVSALLLHSNLHLQKSPSCEDVQHVSHEDQIMALVLRSVLYT